MKKAVVLCFVALFAIAASIGTFGLNPQNQAPTPSSASDTAHSSEDAVTESTPATLSAASSTKSSAQVSLVSADSGEDAGPQTTTARYAGLPVEDYDPTTVLVSVSSIENAQATAARIEQLDYIDSASINETDVHAGFMEVTVADGADPAKVSDMLITQGLNAQPNFVYTLIGEDETGTDVESDGSDPLTTQADESGWMLDSVDAPEAWAASGLEDSSSVVVATIDAGCDTTHTDLTGRFAGYFDTKSLGVTASDVEDASNTTASETYSHGTHVAGIIAANSKNDTGMSGVSNNAQLYIVRALHYSGSSYNAESTDIVKAYDNIIAMKNNGMNIRVANISLGAKRSGALGDADAAVMKKIEEGYANNILTVIAAGNVSASTGNAPYLCYPTDYSDSVLGVINLTNSPSVKRNSMSNYNQTGGRTKDLSAPGTTIKSTMIGNSYGTKSGTSMAAPCVSGVAALVFAVNPSLTAEQAANIICSSALDLGSEGFDETTGYGEVNALCAVQMAKSSQYISGKDSAIKGGSMQLSHGSGWSSDDTSIATVSSDGTVHGVNAGFATINATSNGATVKKTVAIYDASISGSSTLTKGSSSSYSISSTPYGVWSFSSGNASVASITTDGQLTARSAGSTTITATLASNSAVQTNMTIIVQDTTTTPVASEEMYRLYNPNSGEHFYTADAGERDSVVAAGWSYEGVGWTAPESSGAPVYRLYNANGGEHHYTVDAAERDMLVGAGWSYEGVGWYSDDSKATPLYRQYNPNAFANNHNYTASAYERDSLLGAGWNDEGVGWYGL